MVQVNVRSTCKLRVEEIPCEGQSDDIRCFRCSKRSLPFIGVFRPRVELVTCTQCSVWYHKYCAGDIDDNNDFLCSCCRNIKDYIVPISSNILCFFSFVFDVFHMLYHELQKILIDKNIVVFTCQVCQLDAVFIKKAFDQFLGPCYRLKIS